MVMIVRDSGREKHQTSEEISATTCCKGSHDGEVREQHPEEGREPTSQFSTREECNATNERDDTESDGEPVLTEENLPPAGTV